MYLGSGGEVMITTKVKKDNISIRKGTVDDAKELVNIYAYYIENTAISFEYEVPKLEEFQERISNTIEKYPYLVILQNERIVGYAYAGPLKKRAAYDKSVEVTIYIAHNARKCGFGRKLYEALEIELKKMGILNLYACIAYPKENDEHLTKNSEQFHRHMGYEQVGRFHHCGCKFGKWYDIIWMEKMIGEHKF